MRVWGGDLERGGLTFFTGYSAKAQCTGKPAYLQPNSQSMQKPVGGLPVLTISATNNYPEVEPLFQPLYKGGYRQKSHNS
jgi:hypothetical protein